jgi:hypothetical protein
MDTDEKDGGLRGHEKTFVWLVSAAGISGGDRPQVQGQQNVGGSWSEREVSPLSFLAAIEKSGINQQFHVVTHCALRQVGVRSEITDAGSVHTLSSGNLEQEVQPCLVTKCFQLLREVSSIRRWCCGVGGGHV